MVYKLVARATSDDPAAPLLAVEKHSPGKASVGGRPYAVRRHDAGGTATAEVVVTGAAPDPRADERSLHQALVRGGDAVALPTLAEAHEAHRHAMASLPRRALQLSRGEPALPTVFEHR
jgi:nicotinate phosphoribosyltransferase